MRWSSQMMTTELHIKTINLKVKETTMNMDLMRQKGKMMKQRITYHLGEIKHKIWLQKQKRQVLERETYDKDDFERLSVVPKTKNVSFDEQMVPFWGCIPCRQIIKSKPNHYGMKIFVAATSDGLLARGPIVEEDYLQCLGVGGKAVIRLTRNLPTGVSIYVDRFFTSMHLLDLLHSKAHCTGTGTVQLVRIPRNTKLKTDKELEKG
ncbi:hypothetical protein PR048_000758 [Dryococelus australis]|uniref:PiggyBac transposable element-derived protein domain-containing protein n=1 Tax=Dryococelus australis TaxID=614101 RepID=A0ABQ9IFM5_9NEOP|nr:hypothetical protein PR048_000758 [Dryococelus australis]